MEKKKPSIEIHVKSYAQSRGTKDMIGLRTRVIVNHPQGNSTIHDFEYLSEARAFIFENYGTYKAGGYDYVNHFTKYGDKGYQWK